MTKKHMSHVMRKPDIAYRQYNPSSSYIHIFKLLAINCDSTGWFECDLNRNPKNRLSCIMADMVYVPAV